MKITRRIFDITFCFIWLVLLLLFWRFFSSNQTHPNNNCYCYNYSNKWNHSAQNYSKYNSTRESIILTRISCVTIFAFTLFFENKIISRVNILKEPLFGKYKIYFQRNAMSQFLRKWQEFLTRSPFGDYL